MTGIIVVAFGIVSFVSGLLSAWYWYQATRILFEPEYDKLAIDAPELDFNWALVRAIMVAVTEAGRLNRRAAYWTAVAVVFGSGGTVIAALTLYQ